MVIDDRTRKILQEKLNFSVDHIERLEKNRDLLSKTLGLIDSIRQTSLKERRVNMVEQLKAIRDNLVRPANPVLLRARSEYYSFQRLSG